MTPPTFSNSHYRPDIDGLRAVAVLGVILFHIDTRWLPGGFIGVDIFFVISGYLITGIIAKEIREGHFTFLRFYERRIRRIFPALWVLLVICVPVSWWLMLPADAEAMGKSALWSVLAMANVYFWHEVTTDYFAPQSALFPFLHLWSLGVEEQFYLLWPLILLTVWRLAKQKQQAVACVLAMVIVLTSTLLTEWLLAEQKTRFAYYMLPPRAGELALGAAIALIRIPFSGGSLTVTAARALAIIGWGLLAYSLFALTEDDPFPGWRALLPTIGTAALILSGQLMPANGWLLPLHWKPALWLGRCSYSAYLWHWPILAWWRYLWGQPNIVESLALLALILVVAGISQRFVEDPARLSRGTWSRTMVLYGFAPALIIATLALLAARGDRWGLPLYAESERAAWSQLETFTQPAHRVKWVCQQNILDPAILNDPECEWGSGDGAVRILLLGDSHAAQFAPMFRIAAETQGLRMRSVALGSCAPVPGSLKGVVAEWRVEICEKGIPEMLKHASDYSLLIIGAAWTNYAQNDSNIWARLELQLSELVDKNHRIWLLPEVPAFNDFDTACPAKRQRVGDWLFCPIELQPRNPNSDTNTRLAAIAQRLPGVRFLPLHESLCPAGSTCPVADAQGHYLYADSSHLSVYGSRYLADILVRANQLPDLSEATNTKANSAQSDL